MNITSSVAAPTLKVGDIVRIKDWKVLATVHRPLGLCDYSDCHNGGRDGCIEVTYGNIGTVTAIKASDVVEVVG